MESVDAALLLHQVTEVTINLRPKSKHEMLELRRKLEGELDLVRNLVKKIEGTERKPPTATAGNGRIDVTNNNTNNSSKAKRAHLQQLSVSVTDNITAKGDGGGGASVAADNVEKEKRTPKANKLYRNSEFLLAKDKFPPSETNKKTKPHVKKQGGTNESTGQGMVISNKALKNCGALLERLMKHKHGWVFNTPVDPVSLGLHDYLDIIKHPMDLGTVKSRLDTNWYKSPKELAEDVRLTFNNAMTYNPKGQDVYLMAEQLLKIFEEKWTVIESDYMQELRLLAAINKEATPLSRKNAPPLVSPSCPTPAKRVSDRSESSMNLPSESHRNATGSGRTPAPKKPKAREPDKRDMTYAEKQKLSSNLQNLPSDKLDDVVKIIKKRNSSLCQNDDEIEVDIDSVDTETLWELDRFVINYKKSLSKNKKKAEFAIQATTADPEPDAHVHARAQKKDPVPIVVEEPKEMESDVKNGSSPSPDRVEQQGENTNRSNSAGSSSGGSGSSSSGSDSESSSEDGFHAGHSPKAQV